MSFFCVEGRKLECDGCMCCRFTDVEGECYICGATVHIDEEFEYVFGKLYCQECAEEIEEEE